MKEFLRPMKINLVVMFSLLLGACSSAITPDFSVMSAKYAKSLEEYQISMIFLNIMRTSENRPVSFLDMPTINGSGSISVAPSIGAVFTNGLSVPTSVSSTLFLNNTFNFTQSSLDNAVFWKSYLNEIPKDTVKYFSHNHIPKEVILSLAVDEFEVINPNGKSQIYVNNPLRPDYDQFQKFLYKLIDEGLTAEKIDLSAKLGPPLTIDKVVPRFGEHAFIMFKETGISLKKIDSAPNPLYQPIQVSSKYKLCVNSDLYSNYLLTKKHGEKIYCEENNDEHLMQTSDEKKRQPLLIVRIRSANNIFEYLGQVVKAQLSEKPYLVTLPPSATTLKDNSDELNKYALIVVNKGVSSQKPFAIVEGVDGETYSIPKSNSGYSTLSIKLLSQLMSLQKIPGSIPASPSVLLK